MGWKPKEKPLTEEEAILLAKRELAPFWFNSAPILAGVNSAGVFSAHPLEPGFRTADWLIFFVQSFDFSGQKALSFIAEWYQRFSTYHLKFLLVLKPPYPSIRPEVVMHQANQNHVFSFPSVVDHDGALFDAFRVERLPKFVLLRAGREVLWKEGEGWFAETEGEIQKFIRERDPGTPFPPFFHPETKNCLDISQIHFAAPFVNRNEFQFLGKWSLDNEKLSTSDASALIRFSAPSSVVSMIAESASKLGEPAKMLVEVNNRAAIDIVAGRDLHLDEDGNSLVKVQGASLYHVLTHLPTEMRQICFRFPTADRVSVVLYGLRFGELPDHL